MFLLENRNDRTIFSSRYISFLLLGFSLNFPWFVNIFSHVTSDCKMKLKDIIGRSIIRSDQISHSVMSDSFATPWTPLSIWFPREEYWSRLPCPFSRGFSQPRDWTCVSCIGRWILYHWATTEARLVSAVQQSESAIRLHMSPLFWISFPFRPPQSTEFPVLYRRSLLVICFIHSSVYMSIPISQFMWQHFI